MEHPPEYRVRKGSHQFQRKQDNHQKSVFNKPFSSRCRSRNVDRGLNSIMHMCLSQLLLLSYIPHFLTPKGPEMTCDQLTTTSPLLRVGSFNHKNCGPFGSSEGHHKRRFLSDHPYYGASYNRFGR